MTVGSAVRNTHPRAVAAILLAACLSAGAGVARAQTVNGEVRAVESHYREVSGLTATVVQKNHLQAIGKTQTFEGTLRLKKPGRLRIDYTNGQVILVDGKTALFYSKKSRQVIRKNFRDIEEMNIPVAFLLGAAHIRDDFAVLQPDPKKPRTLELLPKRGAATMQKLTLRSGADGRIEELVIFDRLGNRTELFFSDEKPDAKIKDSVFVFKPPKGTEIIDQ